jgi:hypothetical protein
MRLFLQFFALSDRYERKARLLPGLILAAAPAMTAGALIQKFGGWYTAVSTSIGIEFLVAIVLGHYARARGRAVEDSLWASWGGPPATRWLRPSDMTCSEQQKTKWRGAIKRLTGMTIPASIPEGGSEVSIDRVIVEATRQLRYVLRDNPNAAILQSHNEDYGFARNLYAVRWLWVILSTLCVAASGVALGLKMEAYAGIAVSVAFLAVTALVTSELPRYVRHCSDRYAESLFAVAMLPEAVSAAAEKKAKS